MFQYHWKGNLFFSNMDLNNWRLFVFYSKVTVIRSR